MRHRVVGIDLGTAYSAVAVWDDDLDQADVLPNREDGGQPTTPSVVAFDPATGTVSVGQAAKRSRIVRPEHTITEIKRCGPGDPAQVRFAWEWRRPQEISALILTRMKEVAEAELGGEIRDAVISVPACSWRPSARRPSRRPGWPGCGRAGWSRSRRRPPSATRSTGTRRDAAPTWSTTWAAAPSTCRSSRSRTRRSGSSPPPGTTTWAAATSTGQAAAKGVGPDQLDAVLLVGGSTKIPKVKRTLVDYFGRGEGFVKLDLDPATVVARGAAVLARTFEPGEGPDWA